MHTVNDFIPRLHHRAQRPGEPATGRRPGLVARLLGGLAGIALLAAAVLFSAVLLVLVLAAGIAVLGWLWWQTRAVRRALREQSRAGQPGESGARSRPASPTDGARAPLARRQADVEDAEIVREVPARDDAARR